MSKGKLIFTVLWLLAPVFIIGETLLLSGILSLFQMIHDAQIAYVFGR